MDNKLDFKKSASLYGFIFGLYSCLLLYFDYKFNLEKTTIMSLLSFTIAVLLIFFPVHQYKLNNSNTLRISDALKIGLIIGVIGGLMYAAYTYFHYTQLDTEFVTQALEDAKKSVEENSGNFSEEDLKNSEEMVNSFVSPFTFATINLIAILFKTFIISIVLGLIKKS